MPQVRVIQPISEQAKKLRVAAYARVSSDSADQLNSFATQVAYYTDFIQSKDEWEFAGLYADEAVSGTTGRQAGRFPTPACRLPCRKNRPYPCEIHLPVCTKHLRLPSDRARTQAAWRGGGV